MSQVYKPGSKAEARVYEALKLLGKYNIVTEYTLPNRLYLDFLIRELGLAFEVDGVQHDKFNSFFHSDKEAFAAQRRRDALKDAVCADEGWTLVRLGYKEVMTTRSAEDLLTLIYRSIEKAKQKDSAEEDPWSEEG